MGQTGGSAGHVLVVAATRVARLLVGGQLAPHGFDVREAADGAAAISAAAVRTPDVFLVDAELPDDGGLDLLDRLKATPALAHVPVVLVSHRTGSDEVAEGLRRGAHDYLRKPLEPSELVARVMAAARLKALQDRLRSTNAELRHTAGTDPLTGLPNRRAGAEELDRLVSRARRHEVPFALVLADIDHFKAINDTYGHAAGDEALVGIAGRLRAVCRRGDLLARWGGEELIVLTEEDADGGAGALAGRLCSTVAAAPLPVQGVDVAVTLSVGWTDWRRGDDRETLLARADRALYAAKAAGRGRACSDTAATRA
jgi:diguanylate cyclase (GGDEF)-like protein